MGRQKGPTTPRKETQDRIGEPTPAHTCHFLFALSVGLPKKAKPLKYEKPKNNECYEYL